MAPCSPTFWHQSAMWSQSSGDGNRTTIPRTSARVCDHSTRSSVTADCQPWLTLFVKVKVCWSVVFSLVYQVQDVSLFISVVTEFGTTVSSSVYGVWDVKSHDRRSVFSFGSLFVTCNLKTGGFITTDNVRYVSQSKRWMANCWKFGFINECQWTNNTSGVTQTWHITKRCLRDVCNTAGCIETC